MATQLKPLDKRILGVLRLRDEHQVIKDLKEVIEDYGRLSIDHWRNLTTSQGNGLLHELVEKDWAEALRCVLEDHKLNPNQQREKDGLTALDLAKASKNKHMQEVLEVAVRKQEERDEEIQLAKQEKEKLGNIAWVDLEFTALENGKILEVAVIATNKDLAVLGEDEWCIHFNQHELDELSEWHQNTFGGRGEKGNGLFADVVRSRNTKNDVEKKLLDFLKKHFVEKRCSLAGNSVHVDKEVLKREMPSVHDYLSHRIIDVSSFQEILHRWAPGIDMKIKKDMAGGNEPVSHRAIDDIRRSIAYMKEFRLYLDVLVNPRDNRNHRAKRASSESDRRSSRSINTDNRESEDLVKLSHDEQWLKKRMEFHKDAERKLSYSKKEEQEIFLTNPHLQEVFLQQKRLRKVRISLNEHDRTLQPRGTDPIEKPLTNGSMSTLEYWEQRKLAIVEIEFITEFSVQDSTTVIYAGVPPKAYIKYLSKLFENCVFIIWSEKEIRLPQGNNIRLVHEPVSEDGAKKIVKDYKNSLFICNLWYNRRTAANSMPAPDMTEQWRLFSLLKPQAALLFFRPPTNADKFTYLKGDFVTEPWSTTFSRECRLIVKKEEKKVYNIQQFVDDMKYFQEVTRVSHYDELMNTSEYEGLDHCYDCQAEIFILQNYLKKIKKIQEKQKLKVEIGKISSKLSEELNDETRSVFWNKRTLDVLNVEFK